jgi:Predicted membrane protein
MRFGFGNGVYNGYGCGILGGGGFWMIFIGLLVIGLIVYLIYKLSKKEKAVPSNPINESLRILDLRLAKGEISEEEYKSIKAALLNKT